MKLKLAFGKTGLEINLENSQDIIVVEPKFVSGLTDPEKALLSALEDPIKSPSLREMVRPNDTVGIIFSDITRPMPRQKVIQAILSELSHVSRKNIILFNALGTHRKNTKTELRKMLGDALFTEFQIVQNDAFDESTQVCLGTASRGQEIWLNRALVDCDIKILTGFIEPHLFAGFSGGGKAIMPGMAGQQTILANHDAVMIGNPNATWGITKNNPILTEIHEVMQSVGNTFLVNVALNKYKEIIQVFAGNLVAAHSEGCKFVKDITMVPLPHSFDIVITTNSGYPLDLNLYQAIKGVSAAAKIVSKGGAIIVAAECWDGIPDHGLYKQLLQEADSPRQLLDSIQSSKETRRDQWQAQIQVQVQLKSDVYVRTDNLTDAQIESMLLKPCRSIEDTVITLIEKYGSQARICVMPEGPQTIPYIE
jgi:nickel-dependent lactate racemase